MDPLLTVKDAAERLNYSEKTIYRMVHRGQLPYVKFEGSSVYRFKRMVSNDRGHLRNRFAGRALLVELAQIHLPRLLASGHCAVATGSTEVTLAAKVAQGGTMKRFRCHHCRKWAERPAGHVNRSLAMGLNLYCSRKCSGLGRRCNKSAADKKAEKREYDKVYRSRNLEQIKTKKRAYFKRTYDPNKARVERKKRMARHVEYCRQPKYKKWKYEYDRRYRAREFGPFADSHLLVVDLNREIKKRSSNYEIRKENETLNKKQERSRQNSEIGGGSRH